ncbi:MAG: hypothetical protein N2Z81_00655 [Hydrogenothermaceae bacterium]|nr:hypothetical protein [Hydrogenothermaceae bacterium]
MPDDIYKEIFINFDPTEYSEKNIIEAIKLLKNINENQKGESQTFRIVKESYIKVYTKNNYQELGNIIDWEDAIDFLGRKYQNYRKDNLKTTIEYQNLKNYMQSNCSWKSIKKNKWNFAFGLPLRINSKNGIKKLLGINDGKIVSIGEFKIKIKKKNEYEYNNRLASSVWFSIKKDRDNKYMYILSYLDGTFLSDDSKIVFKIDKNKDLTNPLYSKCNKPISEIEFEYSSEEVNNKAKDFIIKFPQI